MAAQQVRQRLATSCAGRRAAGDAGVPISAASCILGILVLCSRHRMHGDHLAERKNHGTVHAGPAHGASRSAPLCRRACRWLPPAVTKRFMSCGSHAPAHSCGSSPADSAAAICAAPPLICIPAGLQAWPSCTN